MGLNKFDIKSDGIADVYRAAFYLAKGAEEVGLEFLKQARKKLGKRLMESPPRLKNRRQQLIWAEKILDQYIKLKYARS